MTRLRRLIGEEHGFALVLALSVTVVFSMTVVTVIESAASNSRTANRSKGRISAYSLAEAGINNAASILSKSNPYRLSHSPSPGDIRPGGLREPARLPHGRRATRQHLLPYSWSYDGGTATMSGSFDLNTQNWTITSTGSVRDAFGGAPTTRILNATVHIRAQASQTNVVPAWNYVFVKDTTPNVCNVTLDNTTSLTSSLYVEGNLCFKNSAGISETVAADPVLLEVRGSSSGCLDRRRGWASPPHSRRSRQRRSVAAAPAAASQPLLIRARPRPITSTSRPAATARSRPSSTRRR